MTAKELYDRDFLEWSRSNAALLRAGRVQEADLEHIAGAAGTSPEVEAPAGASRRIEQSPSLAAVLRQGLKRTYRRAAGHAALGNWSAKEQVCGNLPLHLGTDS